MTHDDLRPQIDAFLARWRTASLATVDDAGRPYAANVWYAHDDQFRLIFVSDPASSHSRHIAACPEVALTIYAEGCQPLEIHGLQIRGRCELLPSDTGDWARAWDVYAHKYPFVNQLWLRPIIQKQAFYRVTPTWLKWTDNRRRFGWKWEGTLPPSPSSGGGREPG